MPVGPAGFSVMASFPVADFSAFPVYLATVANRVDDESLLRVEYLVDNPEVTNSKLVESGQAAA